MAAPPSPTRPQLTRLDLTRDVVALTEDLVDVESVSLGEARLADLIEAALRALPHLEVDPPGQLAGRAHRPRAARARRGGRPHRHRAARRQPAVPQRRRPRCTGCGTCDMKGGVAVALRLAHDVVEPDRDLTFVFYEAEEIDGALQRPGPDRRAAARPAGGDFAILMEPTRRGGRGGLPGHHAGRGRAPAASAPTPRGPGAASTRSTGPPRCSAGSTTTTRGGR